MSFKLGQRIVVRDSEPTRALGIAGWHGAVVGESYEDDTPAEITAYAVALDEGDELVWMVESSDLDLDSG